MGSASEKSVFRLLLSLTGEKGLSGSTSCPVLTTRGIDTILEADATGRDWDLGGVEGRSIETGRDAVELEAVCLDSFLYNLYFSAVHGVRVCAHRTLMKDSAHACPACF